MSRHHAQRARAKRIAKKWREDVLVALTNARKAAEFMARCERGFLIEISKPDHPFWTVKETAT